jgi:hypothetical protein
MNLLFDTRGNLQPSGVTECNIEELKAMFVDQFEPNQVRQELFTQLIQYNLDLHDLIGMPFVQWINGSFISRKNAPEDIDLVTFIDWEFYSVHDAVIDRQFGKSKAKDSYPNLDAYTVYQYPANHSLYPIYHADQLYWLDWFSKTRYNRTKQRFSKGFIQLKIE